jgi:hypothetical protein
MNLAGVWLLGSAALALNFALFYPGPDSGAQGICHQSCFYGKLVAFVYP